MTIPGPGEISPKDSPSDAREKTLRRIRQLSITRYVGLALVGVWFAAVALVPRSDVGRFLTTRPGMAIAFAAVAINLTGVIGLFVLKMRRR